MYLKMIEKHNLTWKKWKLIILPSKNPVKVAQIQYYVPLEHEKRQATFTVPETCKSWKIDFAILFNIEYDWAKQLSAHYWPSYNFKNFVVFVPPSFLSKFAIERTFPHISPEEQIYIRLTIFSLYTPCNTYC